MKKKILILWAWGMLAFEFNETQKMYFDIIALTRSQCDVTSFESVLQNVHFYEPDMILDLAAYTDVKNAEKERMQAFSVNTLWAYHVAKVASICNTSLIFLSTDYVFDGENEFGYSPNNTPNPINNYGISKYIAETLIRQEYKKGIIVRTSALFGGNFTNGGKMWTTAHRNFINSIFELAQKQKEISVINDSYTLPTSCQDLSHALGIVIEQSEKYEWQILHFTNTWPIWWITWYEYAKEIVRLLDLPANIIPISTASYDAEVKRPIRWVLINTSDITLPDWKMALHEYVARTTY